MQLDDLLRLLRTRWYIIVAVTGTLVLLTWALVPSRVPSTGQARFVATVTMVTNSGTATPTTNSKTQGSQLATYVLVATAGRVPAVVAEQQGISVGEVSSRVEVTPSIPTNSLSIAATDRTSEAAAGLADLVGTELLRALGEQAAAERVATRAALVQQVDDLTVEASRLAARVSTDTTAKAALESTNRQITTQRAKITEIDGTVPVPPLRPLGPAAVRQQVGEAKVADKLLALPVRSLLAFLVGLGASVGVLLLADRFDVRLHTKEAVEVAFGLPVLAEVPILPRKLRRTLVVADAPETAFAEAHRIMRTSVDVARLALGGAAEAQQERPRLIVVTSADPGEGKTTTAANLAASFAEAGRSTLLVGADLRRSDLLEIVRGPLRAEVVSLGLAPPDTRPVRVRVAPTSLEHLRSATVEAPLGRPPLVLPLLARWLDSQRDHVDVVIVDTPPILVCNDASEMIPGADAVLVVCRVGSTTAEAAERCSELLARLRAKVIGVVMVGSPLRTPVRKIYGYGPTGMLRPADLRPFDEPEHDPPAGDPATRNGKDPEPAPDDLLR